LGITSDEALSLEELPKRAVVFGGGYAMICLLFYSMLIDRLLFHGWLFWYTLVQFHVTQVYCCWVCFNMERDGC